MNARLVQEIANTVLYEGYILYPYRLSALKNRQRFNFGVVEPRLETHGDEAGGSIHTECLVRAAVHLELVVRVRWLQLVSRVMSS